MAQALGRGSEANGPLGRSVIGGILAGLVTTLFVVPSLYSLVVKETVETAEWGITDAEVEAKESDGI